MHNNCKVKEIYEKNEILIIKKLLSTLEFISQSYNWHLITANVTKSYLLFGFVRIACYDKTMSIVNDASVWKVQSIRVNLLPIKLLVDLITVWKIGNYCLRWTVINKSFDHFTKICTEFNLTNSFDTSKRRKIFVKNSICLNYYRVGKF